MDGTDGLDRRKLVQLYELLAIISLEEDIADQFEDAVPYTYPTYSRRTDLFTFLKNYKVRVDYVRDWFKTLDRMLQRASTPGKKYLTRAVVDAYFSNLYNVMPYSKIRELLCGLDKEGVPSSPWYPTLAAYIVPELDGENNRARLKRVIEEMQQQDPSLGKEP
jgi:hypothetical protein